MRKPDNCIMSKSMNKRNENAPDFYGKMEVSPELLRYLNQAAQNGSAEIELSMWKKTNDRGTYLSLQIKKPYQPAGRQNGGGSYNSRPQSREDDFDDEIPF